MNHETDVGIKDDIPIKTEAYAHPSRSKYDHVSRRGMREKDEYYDISWLAKVK